MAYTSPTIKPSNTTFAQFRAGGFQGQLVRLADANAFPPAVRSLLLGRFEAIPTGIAHIVDAFLRGDPVTTADANAKLLVYATALKAISAALEEINVLVDANPGSLKRVAGPGTTGARQVRTFP
ncbi:MAG TPA: hypothetical protein VG406_14220 [Isosphaeraceae bacterium]|nr:hypothetical protein [Isosphaeraceae bacterium]